MLLNVRNKKYESNKLFLNDMNNLPRLDLVEGINFSVFVV